MRVLTQRDKAYAKLSKLSQLKVDLDSAQKIEDKFEVAIRHGHLQLIQHFLQCGLSPETILRGNLGEPASHIAMYFCNENLDIFHLFLRHGLLLDYTDKEGNNALHWIIEKIKSYIYLDFLPNLDEKIELFKILLASGCNVDHCNSKGKKPLQLLEETPLSETTQVQKYKILTKVYEAIKEVSSGQFKYINPLPEITPLSPEQLNLSTNEELSVLFFQSMNYEKLIGQEEIRISQAVNRLFGSEATTPSSSITFFSFERNSKGDPCGGIIRTTFRRD